MSDKINNNQLQDEANNSENSQGGPQGQGGQGQMPSLEEGKQA